jgi:predicted membrane-bound mannosyltransferase
VYSTNSQTNNRYAKLIALLLISFGTALRLGGYLVHRSLWGDEIALALNIRFRGFLGLMQRLDYEQTMPIPLLMLNKLLISILGPSEYTFRVATLLIGCCTIVVFWLVCRRLFGERVALIAVAPSDLLFHRAETI